MGSNWMMRSKELVKIMWRCVYEAVIVMFRQGRGEKGTDTPIQTGGQRYTERNGGIDKNS